jgi:uncharacterized membrane protein
MQPISGPSARSAAGMIAMLVVLASPSPAHADFLLCNRMSYVLDAALALESKDAAATRGWFRIDPGQCGIVLRGELAAEQVYVHVRTLALYGTAPLPQTGDGNFCVTERNFVIAAARQCRGGQKLARFTRVKPSQVENDLTAHLAEEAGYDDAQARRAGIQRLLTVAGYDASPIDGVSGPKTEAALTQFLKDRGLPAETSIKADFFKTLIAAARNPAGTGFAWCNETSHMVMAALGFDEKGAVLTRGWYRVAPGQCVRPELRGEAKRLYSYAEAVDADGRPIKRGATKISWGGDTVLCTRESKFELSEQKDCGARGLTSAGFAAIDVAGKPATTVRFKE